MAQKMTEVGGVPLVFTSYGTTAETPAEITVTTPHGFLPTYVRSMDNTGTNPNTYEWYYGMPAASAIVRTGSSGVSTYISSAGFTVAAGSIKLGTGVQAATALEYALTAFMARADGSNIGGVPAFFSTSGTSAGTEAAVTITTYPGFYPDWVRVVDDYNATNPSTTEWFKSMASPSAIIDTGSTGILTYGTTNNITVAAGSIIIGTGCQINDGNYVVFAGRFSQISEVTVGGTPIAFGYSGTSAATEAAVAISTPDGFYPDWVRVVDDNNATNSNPVEWFKGGCTNPGGILTTGAATGANTLLTTTGITVASGSITIGTGCQINSGNYTLYAARYTL